MMRSVIDDNNDRLDTYKIQSKKIRDGIHELDLELEILSRDILKLSSLNSAIKAKLGLKG